MANPEHLKNLKNGVEPWNKWREGNPRIRPNLKKASLPCAYLDGANLGGANLVMANLAGVDLVGADLVGADLGGANLGGADLAGADLRTANLRWADLGRATLRGADFRRAEFHGAALGQAILDGADFTHARVSSTLFADNDFSAVKGLEKVWHEGPSTIGIDTIYKSKGKIPEAFLRGCGVPEEFIVYMRSLVSNPIEFYSCFISYSSQDDAFAQRLHADLQQKGVRCWFAPEDLKIGDKFRTRIEESIRVYDKVMVVLSENSIRSPWVEEEVEAALEKERKQNKPALFPIRLDDAVMETDQAWAASLRRTRHIGDFRAWKDHDQYQKAFERLLRDLKA